MKGKKRPPLVTRIIVPGENQPQTLSVEKCATLYAILFAGEHVRIRQEPAYTNSATVRYRKTVYKCAGQAKRAVKRLNEQFKTDQFTVSRLVTV